MSVLPLPEACPARAGAQRCGGTRRRVPPRLPARIALRCPALRRTQVCPAVYTPSKPKYTVTSCPIHPSGICPAIDPPLSAYSALLPDRERKLLEAILAAL